MANSNIKPKVTKKKGDTTQGVTIQNITIRPVVRSSQDIGKWRSAMQSAEGINPIRVPLYDLYEDILLDAVLDSVMRKRILGVTKAKLTFVDKNGNEVKEVTELINLKQFRYLRKELMKQKFWGITVVELTIRDGKFNVYSVPRKHIKPKTGTITFEQYGTEGINYRETPNDRYIIEVGACDDLGLLLQAAPYVIYKRGAFGDWANFAEMFGIPFREARYDGYNDNVRKQLETALENIGSAGYAILPKEAELKVHEASNTQGTGELYNMLRRACNEELSILVLGQSSTTIATPGKLGGQDTAANTEDDINANDRADEISILNEQVLPILANLGYPVEGGSFRHKIPKEQLCLKDKASVLVIMKTKLGMPLDDDDLYKEFGIVKPANYAEQKSKLAASIPEENREPVQEPGAVKQKKPARKKKDNVATQLAALEPLIAKMQAFFA